jgi:hypothetical protein
LYLSAFKLASLCPLCSTAFWRKLHIEDLHNLFSPPNVIKIIKLKGMSWVGHVASLGEKRIQTKFWQENSKKGVARPRHGWRIILKWVLNKYDGRG